MADGGVMQAVIDEFDAVLERAHLKGVENAGAAERADRATQKVGGASERESDLFRGFEPSRRRTRQRSGRDGIGRRKAAPQSRRRNRGAPRKRRRSEAEP